MVDALKLINPDFDFDFGGQTYKVRKATLEKVIQFQARFAEFTEAKDPAIEKKMAGYCLYLVLKDVVPGATEESILAGVPDLEMADVVEYFGFMSGQKAAVLRGILQRNAPAQQQTGE